MTVSQQIPLGISRDVNSRLFGEDGNDTLLSQRHLAGQVESKLTSDGNQKLQSICTP